MPKFFTNAENGPALFTGLGVGSWQTDIDLDLDATFVGSAPTIPVTATGVILRFVNATDGTEYAIGARNPDSAANIITDLYSPVDGGQVQAICGTNSAHEIDLYIESANVDVYLIGYFEGEANFFSDGGQSNFGVSSSGIWETIDLSSPLSTGAVFAIIEVDRPSLNAGWTFRHPDSTDNRVQYGADNGVYHQWVIVPVDSSGNIEMYSLTTATAFTLIGEITSNAENRTSGGDVSIATTGSYATVDFSGLNPPADAVFAIVEISGSASGSRKFAFKPYEADGSPYTDLYEDTFNQARFVIMPMIDTDGSKNERCQAKIEATLLDFYVWGYITEADTGSTLIIQEIGQAQAVDNLALIQQHTLAIDPINQGQTLDSPALIQANILVVNPMDQDQAVDNITLSTGITLVVPGNTQAQTLGSLDLIQQHTLGIDPIDQGQVVDNIVLSAGVVLQIAETVQAQDIDVVTLIPQFTLAVDPLDQGQALDNITLDSGVILAIAEMIQSQALDNLILTQAGNLAIDSIEQGQTIDNVVFAQVDGKIVITLTIKSPGATMGIKSPGINLEAT